jgi:uncharacterized protein (TIGR03083 family)
MLERDTYLAAIEADGETLILGASVAGDREVPTCPEWTVERLLRHVTRLWAWVAASAANAPDEVPMTAIDVPPTGHELFPVAEGALAAALSGLRAADPEVAMTSWAGFVPPIWWCRRLAHETAIHRADGQLAVDGDAPASPIDAALAVDGIDELLELFLPLRYGAGSPVDAPLTAHLHATDADGEWFIRLGDQFEVTHEHAKGDVAIRGTASALMLTVWGRGRHQEVEVFADPPDLVDRLLDALSV